MLFCLKMAVEFLHELNVPFFKVGSGDTNNFPYLEKTAKKGETELSLKWEKNVSNMRLNHQIHFKLNKQLQKHYRVCSLKLNQSGLLLDK